jgi:hypothetical protein
LANKRGTTKGDDSINDYAEIEDTDQTNSSKNMARSYGKYEKLKDTPAHLYGMLVFCFLAKNTSEI